MIWTALTRELFRQKVLQFIHFTNILEKCEISYIKNKISLVPSWQGQEFLQIKVKTLKLLQLLIYHQQIIIFNYLKCVPLMVIVMVMVMVMVMVIGHWSWYITNLKKFHPDQFVLFVLILVLFLHFLHLPLLASHL